MISFLLSTNRIESHKSVVDGSVNAIIESHKDIDFEILVFSESKYTHNSNRVFHIQENGRQGPLYGFNHMARLCNNDYAVCVTDDIRVLHSCVPNLDQVKEIGVAGLNPYSRNIIPRKGDTLGNVPLSVDTPRVHNIRWPVVHKQFLSERLNNHIFHPSLFYHAGDIYLSFYLHHIGVQTDEFVSGISGIQLKDPTFEVDDCNKVRVLIENFDISKGYLQA